MTRAPQFGRRDRGRDSALDQIRMFAFKGDMRLATRVFVDNRISRREFDEHVALGRRQRVEQDALVAQQAISSKESNK
ncbi:hypothetical protein [Pararobbsia silviterrae]|uniref:Uncharacterized protein n=1 Tax=Pararobbsia silviterrae TaxID=1792498 RepID=A0A494XAY6_9BURK|nr:hypothetical protein [Pararobbsia silviterrae]RKP44733.1 hypothetical protein D7S86_27310 [Pararobbsia silviterrae]